LPCISKPSVQSLLLELLSGTQRLGTGTGIVCNAQSGPVLITNWHNLAGLNPTTKNPISPSGFVPDSIRILHNRKKLGEWVFKQEFLKANGAARWKEHPTLGDKADIAALPLTDLSDVELYPYDLNEGADLSVSPAEAVSVVGFPFGIQAGGSLAVWTTGFVASEPIVDFNGLPTFLIDCRTRPGQSGSAVIAHRNGGAVTLNDGSTALFGGPITKFLGIYSGRVHDQSDLGLVWKANAVATLLASC
jgi:hypothetical protein